MIADTPNEIGPQVLATPAAQFAGISPAYNRPTGSAPWKGRCSVRRDRVTKPT